MAPTSLPDGLAAYLRQRFAGREVVRAIELGVDEAKGAGETSKGIGYGSVWRIQLAEGGRAPLDLVLHSPKSDDFGHDRRADRASGALLAYDSFGLLRSHARALDVGAVRADGTLVSLGDTGEFWLLTEWLEGEPYAQDLRRVARDASLGTQDLERAERLARYLAELHFEQPPGGAPAYRRAVRDLVGHGEGIFGMIDGYPDDLPEASAARLEAIELGAVRWRSRLRGRHHRLRRTHGDFHPFNLLFDASGELGVLDTSRGSLGDPADDVACLALNYLFFGLELDDDAWRRSLGRLYHRFFETYLEHRDDPELFEVIGPYFAWRGLVLASPRWYPDLPPRDRDKLLHFVEHALDGTRPFHPALAEEVLRCTAA